MDPIFEEEQQHLLTTHAKLREIEERTINELKHNEAEVSRDKSDMSDDLAIDLTSDDMAMETYADLEAMNRIIDNYSRAAQMGNDKLKQVQYLLHQPYFAKVQLQFKPNEKPKDIYLGAAGMTDENCRHFIVDWRSPVAETYYNQENGETSYVAHGRTIKCNLLLRRQFDLWQDKLNAYFDTTVAIEDPLLLATLAKDRTSKLGNITATIQKEQNRVIRHEDVPALLVNGIAGSGKTSVLLQRIAYLFYTLRDDLRPDQVYLVSPNPVFRLYIDNVLPDMGESNPHCITWKELVDGMGLNGRPSGDPTLGMLKRIDQATENIRFEQNDFCDLRIGSERVISANQVRSAVSKFSKIPVGSRLAGLIEEELLDKLHQRIKRMAKNEDIHDGVSALELDEQIRIFGKLIQPSTEEEFERYAKIFLKDRYQPIEHMIEHADWLRVDRIGQRILCEDNLSACEWLYLKMSLTGCCNRDARYVMIDEVQDYTESQLAVMARWFKNAHFMLLGDENQAIKPNTASFDSIQQIFANEKGEISLCRLMTSYRSSPEITSLFTSLMDQQDRVNVSSVQRPGVKPNIIECADEEKYLDTLRIAINECESSGLVAIVTQDKQRAKWLKKQLGENNVLLSDQALLPDSGVVITPLELAKGLEFDEVIIADGQEEVYQQDLLSRHRLYTAISRATKKVTIISQGTMTSLLR